MNCLWLRRSERPRKSGHRAALTVVLLTMLAFCGHLSTPLSAGASARASETDAIEPAAPTDTAIFSDDFEAYGDSSLWSSEHPFPVRSDVVANGSFAAAHFCWLHNANRSCSSRLMLYLRATFSAVSPME